MANRGPKPWVPSEDEIKKIESLAAQGMDQQNIALCLGIAPETLTRKKHIFEQIDQAIKRGQAKGLARVTSALIKNVQLGNVTAQIYWLKTRYPELWGDRKDETVNKIKYVMEAFWEKINQQNPQQ